MEHQYPSELTPEERAQRRRKREIARQARLRAHHRRQLLGLVPPLCVLLVVLTAVGIKAARNARAQEDSLPVPTAQTAELPQSPPEEARPYEAVETEDTVLLGEEFSSAYAVLIDLRDDTILAQKEAKTPISPASMTKILTILVAAERVTKLDDTVTMTIDITDECYRNGCSVVGYSVGETALVRDLFYGTIGPSGADAALALATYVAGSQEAFVALMNEKLEELGLAETAHFTNCVGLYDPQHVCTVYDMAVILKAAVDNELCREVLSTRVYTTAPTPEHPEGMILSNWFLRRIEDQELDGATVQCAKTGYVAQSGSCAASFAIDETGNGYLCVTGNTYSSWRCIYDHAELYRRFAAKREGT